MDLNATLIGQIITFILFVWFTMKFVWPPLMQVMEARRKQIADGLASAQAGKDELELAQHKSKEMLTEAKAQAAGIVEQAHRRANNIVEEAKQDARQEGERLLRLAQGEIQQEINTARDQLMSEVSGYALAGAEKILGQEIKLQGQDQLIQSVIGEMNG